MRLKLAATTVVAAMALMVSAHAQASTLEIIMAGVDYQYDGQYLCDGDSCNPAPFAESFGDADALTSMDFLVDGVSVGLLGPGDQIGVDFRLEPDAPLAPNVVTTGSGGHMDLYVGGAWGLALDLADWSVVVLTTGSFILTGGGAVGSIHDQLLPFGLIIGAPVSFSFSGLDLQGDLQGLTAFTALGSGEVTGQAVVPEPATLLLLGLGLTGLAVRYRRRRTV